MLFILFVCLLVSFFLSLTVWALFQARGERLKIIKYPTRLK